MQIYPFAVKAVTVIGTRVFITSASVHSLPIGQPVTEDTFYSEHLPARHQSIKH